ncbi:cytochrome c peroxidase [Methylomonas sp. AM2-LC]|uniref:cytochrome c peroxidase n=1 Tax=Methylomonas sp. AM2-LC TaxID=3153301 RepID=UPI003265ADC5
MKNTAIFILLLLGALLFFPLANLLGLSDQNEPIAVLPGHSEKFTMVSKILQNKCVDCHSPGMMRATLYSDLPVVREYLKQDIELARARLVLSEQFFSGEKPATPLMLARLQGVIKHDEMPPEEYRLMHWTGSLTEKEKAIILAWIDEQRANLAWSKDTVAELKAEPVQPLPLTTELNPELVALGKKLFHDPLLSANDKLSCASCHDLTKGGTDQSKVSTGINAQQGPINSPTVYNAMYNIAQFWDGRAKDLQEQAAGPVSNPKEMGAQWDKVIEKLKQVPDYQQAFATLYPAQGLTKNTVTATIAVFEQALLTGNSRFDQYLRGNTTLLTSEEKHGYALFKDNCSSCHLGPVLGGLSYEKMGEEYFKSRSDPLTEADNGRYNVTKQEKDRHYFKVPTLRNIEITHPYFHDGTVDSLAEAVQKMGKVQANKNFTTEEIADLVAFLKTLTGEYQGKSLLQLKMEDFNS